MVKNNDPRPFARRRTLRAITAAVRNGGVMATTTVMTSFVSFLRHEIAPGPRKAAA